MQRYTVSEESKRPCSDALEAVREGTPSEAVRRSALQSVGVLRSTCFGSDRTDRRRSPRQLSRPPWPSTANIHQNITSSASVIHSVYQTAFFVIQCHRVVKKLCSRSGVQTFFFYTILLFSQSFLPNIVIQSSYLLAEPPTSIRGLNRLVKRSLEMQEGGQVFKIAISFVSSTLLFKQRRFSNHPTSPAQNSAWIVLLVARRVALRF